MNNKIFLIAEIGINHNGNLKNIFSLISCAKKYGFDAVKFQKRDINLVYSKEVLEEPRLTPFGKTNGDLKRKLELSFSDYKKIDSYCKKLKIEWFASPWDLKSVDFLMKFKPKYMKIASCMLTITPLIEKIASKKIYTFISTGMSNLNEIDNVIKIFKKFKNKNFELMHCNSSYPCKNENVNLNTIYTLKKRYKCNVGYSGHEKGIQVSIAAAAMGISSLERHVTLDRTMFGSDQAASLGPNGIRLLARDIRIIEAAMGNGIKKINKEEKAARLKLTNLNWFNNNEN